jgi:adenylylsulfate kinase
MVAKREERLMKSIGFTVWLTGLPSSGKTTLARLLKEELDGAGFPVEVLDGDEVRQRLTNGLGFSRKDREENIARIAYVSNLLTRVGAIVVTAAISPYQASRERAKQEIGRMVEVYVNCPLPVCIQRDVKGLYAKAIRGEINNFTGISDPYEPPVNPDVVVHTERESIEESLMKIMEALASLNYIPPSTYPPPNKDSDCREEGNIRHGHVMGAI